MGCYIERNALSPSLLYFNFALLVVTFVKKKKMSIIIYNIPLPISEYGLLCYTYNHFGI